MDQISLDKHGLNKHGLDKQGFDEHGLKFILKLFTHGLRLTLNLVFSAGNRRSYDAKVV